MKERALITGIGILCPLGRGINALLQGIQTGESGLSPITSFNTSPFRTDYGGELKGFDQTIRLTSQEIVEYRDPNIQYALTAARDALDDAGLLTDNSLGKRFALVVGTCNGGLSTAEHQYRIILGIEQGVIDKEMVSLIRYHTMGKALAQGLKIDGPVWITATACSSSTGAIGLALDLIETETVDALIVGGSDSLCLSTMAGFDAIRATSTDRTAPFSLPVGLNLGEGAAFWVVESEKTAAKRGAKIYGEILGYALTSDAHHPTAPDPRGEGAYRTMQNALSRSNISLSELGCINTHGTGTDANDKVESKAIKRLLGEADIPVYSFKSQVGHCLGAAGIIEATAGLTAMQNDILPATINFSEVRPGCNLNFVRNKPKSQTYNCFVSCNYAFGGNNAGVVVAKPFAFAKIDKPRKRVVITGGAMLSSLGIGNKENVDALMKKCRGLDPVSAKFSVETKASRAGFVKEFDIKNIDRRLDIKAMNPISKYATVAARLALADANLRIGPKEGLETGVINGVYVGPSEEQYMNAVIKSEGAEADINGFSQIVANSTAGWVSCALQLKGYSTTVAQGADAGIFALIAAYSAIHNNSAERILAGAADEVYSRYFLNYDQIGYLHEGSLEENYCINLDTPNRRVLGEGAAYLVLEEYEIAKSRKVPIIAEIKGYNVNCDYELFIEPSFSENRLEETICQTMLSANITSDDIDVITWSPQGNSTDRKMLKALQNTFGEKLQQIPIITTVFNTGLMESASGTVSLAAVLFCVKNKLPIWPSINNFETIDRVLLSKTPKNILTIASSDIGYNAAVIFEISDEGRE